jgi:hypothetical protein
MAHGMQASERQAYWQAIMVRWRRCGLTIRALRCVIDCERARGGWPTRRSSQRTAGRSFPLRSPLALVVLPRNSGLRSRHDGGMDANGGPAVGSGRMPREPGQHNRCEIRGF